MCAGSNKPASIRENNRVEITTKAMSEKKSPILPSIKKNKENIVCVLMYMTSKSSAPGLTRADNQMLVDWSPNLCFPDI